MTQIIKPTDQERSLLSRVNDATDRRTFLKWTGVGAAALVATGCDQEETRTITNVQPPDTVELQPPPPPGPAPVTIDFAAGDAAVVNFAYALEQLEAAFYTQVANNLYTGATQEEIDILLDLRDHEVAHREFFQAGLTALGATPIIDLTPNFEAINFSDRMSVLTTARVFEDLGVAAYNGAGQFLENPDLLTIAGKIVSVEARHASAIRDLLNPNSGSQGENGTSFAPNAFDPALLPSAVLEAAAPFIANEITLANAPTA